jgi:hypothetical protein
MYRHVIINLLDKVHIFWEGHKNLKLKIKAPILFDGKFNKTFFQIFVAFLEYMNFIYKIAEKLY